MAIALTDIPGAYTVTADQLQGAFLAAGIRADQALNVMAPLETTPNTVPVLIAEWAGTYTVTGAAGAEAVLAPMGPRGFGFWEAMQPYKA
jgi:hypothetical protein